MKKQNGFGLIGVFLIIGVLILTASESTNYDSFIKLIVK